MLVRQENLAPLQVEKPMRFKVPRVISAEERMAPPMSKGQMLAASEDRRVQERNLILSKSSSSFGTHMQVSLH